MPYMNRAAEGSSRMVAFGGLNLTEAFREGEVSAGTHLDMGMYPALSQRKPPLEEGSYLNPQALFSRGGLFVAAGGSLYLEGEKIGQLSPGSKQISTINSKVVIFPDKVCYDFEKKALVSMEESVSVKGVTFAEGKITLPSGQAWPFRAGDGISISGCTALKENNKTLIARTIEGRELTFDKNALANGSEGASTTVTFKRAVPDLTCICESGNRLWGCAGNVIYGSKLGDPFNFNVFDGLATDSYTVAVGTEGDFTACAPYSSHIVFFKEGVAHKLYGARPANFQLMTAKIPGVREGCAGTLCIASESMYYLGRQGVFVYSGGVPELISFPLGDISAQSACAAVWQGKYLLSAEKGTLCYDLLRQKWLPWGEERACGFAESGGAMYMLCRDGRLLRIGAGEQEEEWSVTLCPFTEDTGRHNSYSRVIIRAEPEEGAWLKIETAEDGGGFVQRALFDSMKKGLRPIALMPNRCERLEIRISGKGQCPIRSLERRFIVGSEY